MILTRHITRISGILLFLIITASFTFGQSTPYILTDFPIALLTPDTAIWIKWTGATRDPLDPDLIPDSGRVYFGTSPGGSVIENYTGSITKRVIDTIINELDTSIVPQNNILFKGNVPQRGIKFRPMDNNMGTGIYYVMVAWKTKIGPLDTTFYSNEVKVIVEAVKASVLSSPANLAKIEDLTPVFQWKNNPGVPYYHIIVSDEKIEPDMDSQTVSGLSIIWEAITANTQMIYGEPDPSGTITADPPPMSPGHEYSWVVLNNYGNHPAYSSLRFSLPSSFTIEGEPLKKPLNAYPDGDTINVLTDSTITLKWTNLDSLANTYKIYIYVTSDFEGIEAQMVVWSTEVTAGSFTGDTASYTVNAKLILTDNDYTWKVIAVDKKGAGTAGDITGFKFNAPTGAIRVLTKEKIAVGDTTLEKAVGLVEIMVEVLGGSLEAPLLFYTDGDGYLLRDRPEGTYRLTSKKDGFVPQTKTVTVNDDDTVVQTFFLERPDATVFGVVRDEAGIAINLAEVVGVSDRRDTVTVETDPLGNFILSCYEADWTIAARKTGYETSLASEVNVTYGENYDFGDPIVLTKFSYTLSGIVRNNSGDALLGVNVKLLMEDNVISSVPSTPQDGSFSFSVEPGAYTLKADKVGFTSYNSSIDILNSTQINITMTAGAALIKGEIMGRSWDSDYEAIFAPITNATVLVVNTSAPYDTVSGVSGAVYGDFAISVEGGKTYKIFGSANGYVQDTSAKLVITEPGKTFNITDTLNALGTIKGSVSIGNRILADLSGISINLIDTATNNIIVTAESDALGSFEIRGVPDTDPGSAFQVVAGRNGLVTDSIFLVDVLGISQSNDMIIMNDGKAKVISTGNIIASINIRLISGTKAIQWVLKNGQTNITDALIKLKSPLVKNVTPEQGIGGVGVGSYIMSIDVDNDSIVDCSYHTYTVSVGPDSINIDTVLMPMVHYVKDTMTPDDSGLVSILITAADTAIDDGYIFFKDINGQIFDSSQYSSESAKGEYTFSVRPAKDGSYMEYYFKIYLNNDIYGYEQETYLTYIKSDSKILTKIAVSPFADDTLFFPADEEITFTFNGYYGSNYSLAEEITASNVTWSFVNDEGCSIKSPAKDAIIKTAGSGTGSKTAVLQVAFKESGGYKLKAGVNSTVSVPLQVSSSKLDSIRIVRVDAGSKEYITTSGVDNAEFVVRGIDTEGNVVTVSSVWDSIAPGVGTISKSVFSPAQNFFGRAQIGVSVGSIKNEYYDINAQKYGIAVHYIIPEHEDTVASDVGCRIIIPDGLNFKSGKDREISLETPILDNNIFTSSSHDSLFGKPMKVKFDVISRIFDITDVDSAVLFDPDSTDSIVISFDIPSEYMDDAQAGKIYVALWNDDEAEWDPVHNSTVSEDGERMRIRSSHFSRYSLVFMTGGTGLDKFKIKPNPFSPYVRPVNEYGLSAPNGTCIEVRAGTDNSLESMGLDIYNVVGDRIWSVVIMNPLSSTLYKVWWDGKTTDGQYMAKGSNMDHYEDFISISRIPTGRMCRNGRYFLVVKIKDSKKQKQYMKQIILFK